MDDRSPVAKQSLRGRGAEVIEAPPRLQLKEERTADVARYDVPTPEFLSTEVNMLPRSDAARTTRPAMMSRALLLLREPLLQFLLVGAALFAGYRFLHPEVFAQDASNRIVITDDDLRQMSAQWLAQGRPPPTAEQWRSLIETKVREEVLFREALALGLDKDDMIVKRRMVQKMDFLGEDLSRLVEPKPDEIRAWFERNKAQFALSPRASFRHVYFSPDRRSQNAQSDAMKALLQIAGKPQDSAMAASGDPFMFQDYYGDRSYDQLAAQFGAKFARVLFDQKPGEWRGPIESRYGWHLVFIDSITPERVRPFEEIEPDVKAQWIAEQREETKRKMYDAMRARYKVVLPDSKAVPDATPASKKSP